jgi:hypothetical protein
VAVDPATGGRRVTLAGTPWPVPAGARLVVRGGAGADVVSVDPAAGPLTLLGGAGADRLTGGNGADTLLGLWGDDVLHGGGGADHASGGTGDDYVDGGSGPDLLDGGDGHDTVYGLAGADVILGGGGRDYLDGGPGEDRLAGGAARDALVGGAGADTVHGGPGDDRLYGGGDRDTLRGGGGADVAYAQPDDHVTGAARHPVPAPPVADLGAVIRVVGSPEFAARVGSDLDALGSSPRGQEMLAALRAAHEASRSPLADWPAVGAFVPAGDGLQIRETAVANGFASEGSAGPARATVDYNPTYRGVAGGSPVTVLFHELAHAYDVLHGTLAEGTHRGPDNPGVPNAERVAVGLPIDDDGDPSTPPRQDPRHPPGLTENALRAELGLSHRPAY